MLNHEDLQPCEHDVSMIGFFSLAKASLAQSGILRISMSKKIPIRTCSSSMERNWISNIKTVEFTGQIPHYHPRIPYPQMTKVSNHPWINHHQKKYPHNPKPIPPNIHPSDRFRVYMSLYLSCRQDHRYFSHDKMRNATRKNRQNMEFTICWRGQLSKNAVNLNYSLNSPTNHSSICHISSRCSLLISQ